MADTGAWQERGGGVDNPMQTMVTWFFIWVLVMDFAAGALETKKKWSHVTKSKLGFNCYHVKKVAPEYGFLQPLWVYTNKSDTAWDGQHTSKHSKDFPETLREKRKNQVFTNLRTDTSAKYGMSKQSRNTTDPENSSQRTWRIFIRRKFVFFLLSFFLLLITYF